MSNLKVGAVVYDPKVTVVWKIIANFFRENGFNIDCVFFKDYKMQVDAFMENKIDIAWNSPLAWVDTFIRTDGRCKKSAMRDTDIDRETLFLAKVDSKISSLSDFKNKKIGFGAIDSPQARLIPVNYLANNGLFSGNDYKEIIFNVGFGLHGDHVGGELDALKALKDDFVDVSVCLDLNYKAWVENGTIDEKQIIQIAKTPKFDHCIFTLQEDIDPKVLENWEKILFKMDYNNKNHKEMMDMEGLKKWVKGRTSGFEQLHEAVKLLNFFN
ncbi:MAG: phosphate/phosphite/phosphonate ABC transporter substrate-binding protein [Campylobacteraceae bacterium]